MDEVDITQARLEKALAEEEAAREATPKYEIPQGVPGDCDLCGDWFGRLVKGVCVPCRMKYKLD